jgi:ornithine cyclodeaminase/alanine dehydrogenase-like protein (mu-crystallin family)
MLLISRAEVEALLTPDLLLDAVARGFRAVSSGAVDAPPRQGVQGEGGALLTMAGRIAGEEIVVKLVGLFPGHPSVISVFDAATGRQLALMDGDHVTTMRTAAGSALSVHVAAREDARVLCVVGTGVQARAHLELLAPEFEEVRVFARNRQKAEELAASYGAIVPDSPSGDVICLTTASPVPVLLAADVAPGTHVTSVGFKPPDGELDPELARASRLIVETRGAFAPPPAGCGELQGLDPGAALELGEILLGQAAGRESPDEITVYKAMGHVAEDAAAAALAYRLAVENGLGRQIEL